MAAAAAHNLPDSHPCSSQGAVNCLHLCVALYCVKGSLSQKECKSSSENPFGNLLGHLEANAKNATQLHLKSETTPEIYTCILRALHSKTPNSTQLKLCNVRKKPKNLIQGFTNCPDTYLHLTTPDNT